MNTEAEQRQLIAQRLREARQLAGLSQGQAAKIMEMHRPTVSEIEAGNRRVSAGEIARFADIYDVSTSYLLGDAPDKLAMDESVEKLRCDQYKAGKAATQNNRTPFRRTLLAKQAPNDDHSKG